MSTEPKEAEVVESKPVEVKNGKKRKPVEVIDLPKDKEWADVRMSTIPAGLPVVASPSMESVLMRAVEQGASIETIERIFAMIEKANAAAAEREFNVALAAFQLAMPVIAKRKHVKDKSGAKRFSYAPIEDILPIARPYLAENGLSVNTGGRVDTTDSVTVYVATAYLKHIAGHTETREFSVPVVLSQFMSDPQSYAAASTFAERYATRKVLGIVTADDDNEGRITPQQAREGREAVRQPQPTPTAQKAAQKGNGGERVQIEPAGEGDVTITEELGQGLSKAMKHATLGLSDLTKRFPKISRLGEIKQADVKVVMSWIADPVVN